MARGAFWATYRIAQGRCRGCRRRIIGPGDRCKDCATLLRAKAAKRKRKR